MFEELCPPPPRFAMGMIAGGVAVGPRAGVDTSVERSFAPTEIFGLSLKA